jgi:hypothetical protein
MALAPGLEKKIHRRKVVVLFEPEINEINECRCKKIYYTKMGFKIRE